MNANFSTKLYLHNVIKADGTYSVRLRAVYQRKQKSINTGYSLTKQDFNLFFKREGKTRALSPERLAIKRSLIELKTKSINVFESINPFTLEQWKIMMSSDAYSNDSVRYFYDLKIAELKQRESYGSASLYNYSIKKLYKFFGRAEDKVIRFHELTPDKLYQYDSWMRDQNLSVTTIVDYMKLLRATFNKAIAAGAISASSYPFGIRDNQYTLPQPNNPKRALEPSIIKQIEDLAIEEGEMLYYRDMWLLCYYLQGINISDLLRLKKTDYDNDIVTFIRKKTARTSNRNIVTAVVNPNARRILVKYEKSGEYLLPHLNGVISEKAKLKRIKFFNRGVNRNMKRVAKLIGYKGSISYMNARHSFATIARNYAPDSLIGQALGHKSIKSTENYFARYGERQYFDLHDAMF